jgi:hypothetical protein
MTNPASLAFGSENGLQPFERIRADDRDRLEAFLARRQPDWKRPAVLTWLTTIAVVAAIACALMIAAGMRGVRRVT